MAHLDFLKKYTFKNIMLRSEMFVNFFCNIHKIFKNIWEQNAIQ